MAQDSKIEWTDHTFNPWIGCTKVSPGCKHCYAEADMDNRRKRVTWGINGTRSVTSYMYWRKVLAWNRDAEFSGERKRVFCASLADVFEYWEGQVVDSHGNGLWWDTSQFEYTGRPDKAVISEKYTDVEGTPTFNHHTEQKEDHEFLTLDIIRHFLFKLIEQTPHLDWLLLTKHPENIMKIVPEHWQSKFPDNVWIGTSVEDQTAANKRIPELLKVPAAVRFLSCEPQLSEISFRWAQWHDYKNRANGTPVMHEGEQCISYGQYDGIKGVNWVIQGGESGHNKRQFDLQWAYKMRDECKEAGIAYFFKQIDKKQAIPEDLMIREFPKTTIV